MTAALIGAGVALAFALAGIALLWRPALTLHGTARWAEPGELRRAGLLARRLEEVRGPIWGKLGPPKSRAPWLSSEKIVHSLVAAPTGAGKGVGVVIPTLLTYPGSTVVLDVKGENYEKTARRRQELGDRVFKFAPYAKDRRSHRYNPFDEVAAAPERRRFSEALRLANSLVEAKGKGTESWVDGAREIFAATAVVALERGTPTIAAVYDLLTAAGRAGGAARRLSRRAPAPVRRGRCSTASPASRRRCSAATCRCSSTVACGSGPIRTCGTRPRRPTSGSPTSGRTRRASFSASARRTSASCRR